MTPHEYIEKWKRVTSRERQAVQENFLDICSLVGYPTPNEMDPSGKTYAFEMGANVIDGGNGWADVAKLGYFGWEYKGKHSDLNKAYAQLLGYRDALKNPPLLIVSDISNIIIRTNYTNLPTRTIIITLNDILNPEILQILRSVFYSPDDLKPVEKDPKVTEEAARQFGKLAEILSMKYSDMQEIAHFLIQLLFCFFAEDIDLLPKKILPHLLDQTRRNPKDFTEVLKQLFRAMNTGGYFGAERIFHFNGGLFSDDKVLELNRDSLDILATIDKLDWSAIDPSIFGTLFERSLDPSKRAQLGVHYTSRTDIEMVVEPVLMAPLRDEWEYTKHRVLELIDLHDKSTNSRNRAKAEKEFTRLLGNFFEKIANIQVLDPACGSGNFLYIALRKLLDLQNEVSQFYSQIGIQRPYITVTPFQIFGIEVNEYAHELAQTTIWIGHIQWMLENGYGLPGEPILKPIQNIRLMDAILGYDVNGKPVEPEWPSCQVIIGNPPFLGGQRMLNELGKKYVSDLRSIYEDRIPGPSDLVCYWFEKSRAMIANGSVTRAGLLATQAIRSGANRTVLDRIKRSGNIFWAQSDHDWILDGATVHVSMVGFDVGRQSFCELDGVQVGSINSDLTSTVDLTKAKRLAENLGICFQGPVKVGPFDIDQETANKMLGLQNPNNKPNSEVIKPILNGSDITSISRNMMIIDFEEMNIEEASLYEAPFEYVKRFVKPLRDINNDMQRKTFWWRLGRSGSSYLRAKQGKSRVIFTPRVSKHRIFVWADNNIVPDSAVVAFAIDSDYVFGILHSKHHELWSRGTGSQLRDAESGFRYTPTSTFETFPFPWPFGSETLGNPIIQEIIEATRDLVEKREIWLHAESVPGSESNQRTLTSLYNQLPTWLDIAHKRLDAAVSTAYGWPVDLSDDEILSRLLALNLERATKK
jgi:hypothetical protein